MKLFPSNEDDKGYDHARKAFSETNNKMTDMIHAKTIDTENIILQFMKMLDLGNNGLEKSKQHFLQIYIL